MYVGALDNGSGDTQRQPAYVKRREAHGACRAKNPPAYDWTAAKFGLTPGQQGIFGGGTGHYARPPTADQHAKMMAECANAFPMYKKYMFEKALKETLPSVEERAQAIADAIAAKQAADAPPMMTIPRGEVPTVVPAAPVSYAAPSPRPPTTAVTPGAGPVFPLMEQWRQAQEAGVPSPAVDVGEPPPVPEKKGAGVGTILLLAAPVILSQML